MVKIITLSTNRSDYDIRDAAEQSISVGELIEELSHYDEDEKVVFKNDNGYTYGYIQPYVIDVQRVETKEEEEERERKEEEEREIEDYKSTMEEIQEELTDLQSRYENDGMTDEEYREERADIFDTYGISEEEYNNFFHLQ